jgi:TolB protein
MKRIFFLFVFSLFCFSLRAEEGMRFDIDNIDINKINVVFEYVNNEQVNKIYDVIKNNLDTTNLFNFSNIEIGNTNVFNTIEDKENISQTFLTERIVDKYNTTNVDAVLTTYVKNQTENNFELVVRFFDILDQRELFSKIYLVEENNWKRTANIISDIIYKNLTNEISGHFDSKILFIAESGTIKDRKKRIAMMDFDGSNLNYLTSGKELVLTPIFSRFNKNEVIYLEYINKIPSLFKINLKENTKQKIGDKDEMTFAPNFHPKLNEMLYSSSKNGITNIYKINFDTGKTEKITNDNAITTVPSYSPDGEKIVFVSDKSGKRRLYVMDESRKVELISKGSGEYDKPAWSPDGRLISFVKIEKGNFFVGLMTPDGESERLPISGYLIDGIKWAPNGRYLIYFKQRDAFGSDSIPYLYTFDILTGYEHKLITPKEQGASDPDWTMK